MRRSHNPSFPLHIEALEARRLLSDDCGCGGDSGPSDEEPNSPPPVDYCYIGSDGNEYCCLESELDWRGKCPDDPEYDPDGPGDPPPEEPPEPNPNPHPKPDDPDDPFPEDPPLPDPDPCADYELKIDLVYEGMREEEVTDPPHPQHETEPGGYLPLNRGFSRWFAEWYDPEHNNTTNPPTTPPFGNLNPDFFEDYQSNERLLTGSLPGIGVLDPQLREGSVSIGTSGGFTLPAGKRVPFSFSVPSGVDLWIFYDPDADGPDLAVWNRVTSGEIFYAGDGRPMGFDLTYEGDDPGLDQMAIARAAVNAYCPESNSWRVLRARDDVKLHVVETELTADSTNDDGLDKSTSTWATVEDEYVEWLNQERPGMLAGPSAGKVLSVNDDDPEDINVPDWADGFNADGDPNGTPGDEQSQAAHFTPIQVTLPARNHGEVRFRFIYPAADPHFSSTADPSARVDPADMMRTFDPASGYRYDMGTGAMRLWTKDGMSQRKGHSIASGGDYVDSQEWDVATGTQQPVYYTHADFAEQFPNVTQADGGTITLWVEALRPSLALGDRSVILQAVLAEEYTDPITGATQTLLPYTYVESKLIPMTVVDVDLDIDSDNTNGFNLPDRSVYEDMLEDNPKLPGKFVAVNDDDTDGDNLIDWADFNGIAGEQFVPLRLVLPAGVDLTGATIRFEYGGSDPAGINPLLGLLAPGTLRLWTKDGDEERSPLGVGNVPSNNVEGNYITPGVELPLAVLFESGAREVTLWAEAVRLSSALGDQRIEMILTLDVAANPWMNTATIQPDAVRMTAAPEIDLVAHRTGGKFGQAVSEDIEDGGNASTYLVLTNNDFEEGNQDGFRDYENDTADVSGADDDLARITLAKLPEFLREGTLTIELSNPQAVRLFEEDGSFLWDSASGSEDALTLNLALPSGYLAGILDDDVDLWLEGLAPDDDFGLSVVFRTSAGNELRRDEVRMTLAEWTFRNAEDYEIWDVVPVWKNALLAAARSGMPIAGREMRSHFRSTLDGLPSNLLVELKVVSGSAPGDEFEDTLVWVGNLAQSERFGVLYSSSDIYGAAPDTPLTTLERAELLNELGINAVHNDEAVLTLKTASEVGIWDNHSRRILSEHLLNIRMGALDDSDWISVGQTVPIEVTSAVTNPSWVWKARTSEGFELTRSGGDEPFEFSFTGLSPGIHWLEIRQGVPDQIAQGTGPWATRIFYRVTDPGDPLSQWDEQAWKALRLDGTAGSIPTDALQRNRRMSWLYAEELYNRKLDAFKWAGGAAFASHLAGDGMAAAWRFIGLEQAQTGFELLASGNFAVYLDSYPQHLAYKAGGIDAIEQMLGGDVDRELQLDGWRDIHAGLDPANPNQERVWLGNEKLLQHEQETTLQESAYAVNAEAVQYWYNVTNSNNPLVPPIRSPIPGHNVSFQDYRLIEPTVPDDASIGHFPSRWHWMTQGGQNSVIPAWRVWSETNGEIDADKLLRGEYV